MKTRQITDSERIALKAATRRVVELAGGPNLASSSTRVAASQLSLYGNVNDAQFVPLDVVVDLDRLAGDNVLLRTLAAMAGFELIARASSQDDSSCITSSAGDLAQEAGQLVSDVITAARDKTITPAEATAISGKALQIEETINEIKERAHSVIARAAK